MKKCSSQPYTQLVGFSLIHSFPSVATDPCEVNKGGCEHQCVYVENEKYKCECDPGFVLNEDRHSCDSKFEEPPLTFLS